MSAFARMLGRKSWKMSGRVNRSLVQDLKTAPQASASGSRAMTCYTCMRDIDYEAIVESTATTAKVLVRHHGCEEIHVFNLGTRHWTADDLNRLTVRRKWFDIAEHVGGPRPERDIGGIPDGIL